MSTNPSRSFNCKNEELPVICRFNVFSLKRDLNDFVSYSPVFGDSFVPGYEKQIDDVSELVQPKTEMAAQKVITERLHGTMDSLIAPINHLTGYINMGNGELKITPESYGLAALRKCIRIKDPEGVMQNLNLIIANNNKYADVLASKGFKPELATRFTDATASIAADKQAQYEIMSSRKLIVQNNMGMLNALNDKLTQVLSIGKILYSDTDPAKAKEYTFAQLLKQVHRSSKPDSGNTDDQSTPPATEPQ
jgi:hypothetical protein